MSKEKILNDDWRILKFSECIQQLNTGLNPRKNFTLGKGEIKYITAKNLTKSGTIDFSKCDFIDEKAKRVVNKRSDIKVGDILFSSRAPIGHCHLIKDEPDFFDIGESIFSIRVNQEIVLPEYLCLYLSSDYFVKMATQNTTGSIIMEIRVSNLMDTSIIVPPKHIQKCIANCLNTVDRKLELNNKINDNLQQMAEMIYDYWFLQFDFPDENGKPYKSSGGKMVWNEKLKKEIPEEWETVELEKIFDFVKGRIPDEFYEKQEDNLVDYLTIEAVNVGASQYCKRDSMILTNGEVLMVMDGAASSEVYVGNKGAIGSTFCKLQIKDNFIGNNLLYLIMKKYENIFKKVNTGSTVPHANKNYINDFCICMPKETSERERLQNVFDDIIAKIIYAKKENQELVSLREFLLPLLMNGQVGFKN